MKSLSPCVGLGFLAWMTVGCLPGGERAQHNDSTWGSGGDGGDGGGGSSGDTCIPGEVCSDQTPQGLYFQGPRLFDTLFAPGGPMVMVAGGTQTISVFWDNQGLHPFLLPFDASGTGVLQIEEALEASVVVTTSGAGSGYLRLVEPGTELLYDRFNLTAMSLTKAELAPLDAAAYVKAPSSPEPWALLASSKTALTLVLWGGQQRLVDDSAVLSVTGDVTVDDTYQSWDVRYITAGASGSVSFSVESASLPQMFVNLPIVLGADTISGVETEYGDPSSATVPLKDYALYCFRALAGKNPVAGATWSFTSSSGISLSDALFPGCVSVFGESVGPASLVVEAAGAQTTLQLQVVSTATGGNPKTQLPWSPAQGAPGRGERAAVFSP